MNAVADQAWYVYCVMPAACGGIMPAACGGIMPAARGGVMPAACGAPSCAAILPGAAIEPVRFGALTVLASRVPRALFDQARAENRTADPDWMAARLQAHHEVNVAATAAGPCLPLSFGALFSSLDLLRDWLAPRHDALCGALVRLGDLTEWSLALQADAVAHAAWLDCHDPALRTLADAAATAGEGTAFLIARRLDKARATARDRHIADEAARVSAGLADAGCTILADPPRGNLPHWTVLTGRGDLPALVASLGAALPAACLSLRLTGPWPAYGFARAALSGEALHA